MLHVSVKNQNISCQMESYIVEECVCYDTIYIKFENMQNNSIAAMDIFVWYKCIKTCTGMTNFKFKRMITSGKAPNFR